MTEPITVTVDNKYELAAVRVRLRLWFLMRLYGLATWIGCIGLRIEDKPPVEYVVMRADLMAELKSAILGALSYVGGVGGDLDTYGSNTYEQLNRVLVELGWQEPDEDD